MQIVYARGGGSQQTEVAEIYRHQSLLWSVHALLSQGS